MDRGGGEYRTFCLGVWAGVVTEEAFSLPLPRMRQRLRPNVSVRLTAFRSREEKNRHWRESIRKGTGGGLDTGKQDSGVIPINSCFLQHNLLGIDQRLMRAICRCTFPTRSRKYLSRRYRALVSRDLSILVFMKGF